MYARCFPPPPRRVSETELRLVARDGEILRLLPAQVFTHVEVDLARRVVREAFAPLPGAESYRAVLLRRLAPLVNARDVVEIQGWKLSWTADPMAVPPFYLTRPVEEALLGRMPVPDAAGSS